jgi:preprotein translocase SecE subunit
MARNRQRAKQRQAARRERQDGGNADGARLNRDARISEPPAEEQVDETPVVDPEFEAPPRDLGHPGSVLDDEPSLDDEEHLEESELEEAAEAEAEALAMEGGGAADEAYTPRGRRGRDAMPTETKGRARFIRLPLAVWAELRRVGARFIQFLVGVWAELRRVQWPDRKALTTLTGVVLGFVLIAGGYLGLLDAIFSRIIQAIL